MFLSINVFSQNIYIEEYSSQQLTITTAGTQIMYQTTYAGVYKYSIVNDTESDTLIFKIKDGNNTFLHRINPGQAYNRSEIYWKAGVIFYVYYIGATGKGRGEVFRKQL